MPSLALRESVWGVRVLVLLDHDIESWVDATANARIEAISARL